MMTTMAAMLGAIPISIGYGAGGESRRPLGLAVVGGLFLLAIDHVVSDAGSVYVHGGRVGLVAAAARTDNAPAEAPQGALGD